MEPAPERRAFTVAAAQMCAGSDVVANLAACRELAAEAARKGAALLALPECFALVGRRMTDRLAVAEVLDRPGPIVGAVREMAREYRMWIVAGGMPEVSPRSESRAYNTCLLVDPDGETRAVYRKIHLFDVQIPGRAELLESSSTEAGSEVVVADTPLARLGLTVCYDVRFPELYREMAVERGAEVLLVPSAFTAHTGAAHWHTLLRARAIENQCFVLAPAQCGVHSPERASHGRSLIVDPWGIVLAQLGDRPGVAVADCSLAELERVRASVPALRHRKL
ncbi:MAG TPA: carbon-nitrogen hydrolase family protein [Kofleriaceae bacterium]|nr:carbon-nitrogen hydrolase family protein [Kofleriaceae bacterium]